MCTNLVAHRLLLFVYFWTFFSILMASAVYDRSDPSRGGFKSLGAITKPSCKTVDRTGNILLNGRMGMETAPFEINSHSGQESELSVVFCLQNKRSSCTNSGLVLCYTSPKRLLFPLQNSSRQSDRLRNICGQRNGVIVSTEIDEKTSRSNFRIDTVYGNTYRFPISNHKCFILWLTYDANLSLSYHRLEDFRVNSVYNSNDNLDLNNTDTPLVYSPQWKHIMKDLGGKPVSMFLKEVSIQPDVQGKVTSLSFLAQGGDRCCALSARVSGVNVIKCYRKWVQVGDECRSSQPGHVTECNFPYTTGHKTFEHEGKRNYSSTSLSQGEEAALFKKLKEMEYNYNNINTQGNQTNLTRLEIGKGDDGKKAKDTGFGVEGSLEAGGKIPIIPGLLDISLDMRANGGYGQQMNSRDSRGDSKKFVDDLAYGNSITQGNITRQNISHDMQERIANALSANRRFNGSTEDMFQLLKEDSEQHAIRNFVRWPDALRRAQLHVICFGLDVRLSITEDFSDNSEIVKRAEEIERQVGYPNPTTYAECPPTNTFDNND